jgi:hypothetical protein
VTYQVSPRAAWLSLRAIGGKLAGGRDTEILLQADRAAVRQGVSTGRLVITWDGGSLTVRVNLDERPPVVSAPRALSHPSCEEHTVTVVASASDASGLTSVTLSWSGPNGDGRVPMSNSGPDWTAQMGRFTLGGDITMRVTAIDSYGRTTTGPAGIATATPCPQ